MEELQILGWIFLAICICVVIPAISKTIILVEDSKEKEQRYQELTTISKDEGDTIRQIMKHYKWKTMYSPTYLAYPIAGCINVDSVAIATKLAAKHAEVFATLNGLDSNLLFKLYYMYNQANGGEICIENTTYSTETVPAKRDVLTGCITEGYTYKCNYETKYHVKFFILESVA